MKKIYGPFGPNRETFSSIESIKKRADQDIPSTKRGVYISDFLADVLFQHHQRYKNQIRSNEFQITPDRAVRIVDSSGNPRWSTFSFKEIFSMPSWEQIAKKQFLKRWQESWRQRILDFSYDPERRNRNPQLKFRFLEGQICALCKNRMATDIDHVSPYHEVIMNLAIHIKIMNDPILQRDLENEWRKPFDRNYDTLMSGAFDEYDSMSSQGKYIFLCKPCHIVVTKKRQK